MCLSNFFLFIADCGQAKDIAGATKTVEKFIDITENLSVGSIIRYSCEGDKIMVPPSKPITCTGTSWVIDSFECLSGYIEYCFAFEF